MSSDTLARARPSATTLRIGVALGGVATALTACQFIVKAWLADGSAEHAALQAFWPVFVAYVVAVGYAALTVPLAVTRALADGAPTIRFSFACVAAAVAGFALYKAIGAGGIGGPTMAFYWGGLALIWSGAVAMIHLCRRWRKPLAVRDWTIYAAAMALIPLTLIPSVPLWPLFFELDPGQAIMTAATSSFALHMLIAHYVIFEILERRPRHT
ncbi:MAG: hypothetical protein ACU85U_10650 [Gammaproteobacteria bacterium]|jgi:hypothetical protein